MRYRPIEDEYDGGDYAEPTRQRTSATRVVPAARKASVPAQRTPKPRVYSTGTIGGVGVRIINMKAVLGNVLVGLIVLICMALAVVIWQHLWFQWMMPRYTYKAYREQIHSTVPACNMDGSLRGESTNGGMIILCAETGKVPSKEQINQWQGYTLWNACYEFGDDIACQQLND